MKESEDQENDLYNTQSSSKINQSFINKPSGEVINSNFKSLFSSEDISSSEREDTETEIEEANGEDGENKKFSLEHLEVKYMKVKDVIGCDDLKEKDNLDLIVFDICVNSSHRYNWVVYRTPKEVKDHILSLNFRFKIRLLKFPEELTKLIAIIQETQIANLILPDSLSKISKIYSYFFSIKQICSLVEFKEFVNISDGSFSIYSSSTKPFEGHAYKKADPHTMRKVFALMCKCIECCVFNAYNRRWVVVKDDMIYYNNESTSKVGKNVYFFDKDVKCKKVDRDTIIIKNQSLELGLRFKTYFERELWYREISLKISSYKSLISSNIFKAYTNEKRLNLSCYFVDGESYFSDLKDKILGAKETIFITDWWLSPEVFLSRPVDMNTYMSLAYQNLPKKQSPPYERLCDLLCSVAEKGVKVYVLVYAECRLALTLNSLHTQLILESLHPNIKVTRHPENALDLLWSHHEKLVVVDQKIAYVGGLDLCWGRFDNAKHVIYEKPNSRLSYSFPGIDYSNARIRDFDKVSEYLKESANRDSELRMPWHDVHCRLIGPVVSDIARHFVERWNHARFGEGGGITNVRANSSFTYGKEGDKGANTQGINQEGWFLSIIKKVAANDFEVEEEETKNIEMSDIGKESNNSLKESMVEKDKKEKSVKENNENNIDNNSSICNISGDSSNDSGDAINKSINETKNSQENTEKIGFKEEKELQTRFLRGKTVIDKDHLMRRSIILDPSRIQSFSNENQQSKDPEDAKNNINIENPNNIQNINNNGRGSYYDILVRRLAGAKADTSRILKQIKNREEKLEAAINLDFYGKGVKSTVQVLRSASKWSAGVKKTENSILQAYYHLIDNAKHYIYIENQFFVSKSFTKQEEKECKYAVSNVVENLIAYHIRKRIERAWNEKKKFRVFIFIPLLPGFAGEPEESSTLQIILKHTYAGINRNFGLSIIEQLEKIMGDSWKDYIGFYSLRNHAEVAGTPMTEIIYIHSKLLIVDDLAVVLGSANINDRSMLGTRDSEFCVLIKEKRRLESMMGNESFMAANFAAGFRKDLMAEHIGLKNDDQLLVDPLSDELWKLINERAKINTSTYFNIFKCYPADEFTSFKKLKEAQKEKNEKDYLKNLRNIYSDENSKIKGHIVEFPLHFLEEEKLGINFFSLENLVPERNFT